MVVVVAVPVELFIFTAEEDNTDENMYCTQRKRRRTDDASKENRLTKTKDARR